MIYISLFLGFYIALPLNMSVHCFLVAIVFCEVSLTVGFFHVCVFVCGVCACIGCMFVCVYVHAYVVYVVSIHTFYAWSHVHVCLCMWSPRLISRVFLDESSPYSLRPGLWIVLRAHWSSWPGWPFAAGISCLSFTSGGNASDPHQLLFTWFLGLPRFWSLYLWSKPFTHRAIVRPLNLEIFVGLSAFLLFGISAKSKVDYSMWLDEGLWSSVQFTFFSFL